MTTWFHTAILATSIAATVAVGLASAAAYNDGRYPIAKKSDRLMAVADRSSAPEVTIEKRSDGKSILIRVPAPVIE
jgi:hypothetical protein